MKFWGEKAREGGLVEEGDEARSVGSAGDGRMGWVFGVCMRIVGGAIRGVGVGAI